MFNKLLIFLGAVCSIAANVDALQRGEVVLSEELLSPAWENYDCHSSSIAQSADGKIIVVWKGGFGEGKSNLDIKTRAGIWQVQLEGKNWGPAEQVHFEQVSAVWNPVVCKLPSHEMLLFYRVGEAPWAAVAFMKRSVNGGAHWSSPEFLPAGIVGPAKNKPLVLEDGTLLCPSSIQAGSPDGVYKSTAVWIDISRDGGKTWSKSAPLVIPGQPFGAIEPALFFDKEGNIRLLCRDRARRIGGTDGAIWSAVSYDRGNTWTRLERTDLPNPDSAFDVVDLEGGRLVLFYNHSHTERFPLSIAVSSDGGMTWKKKCDLEERTGEFPAAICSADGIIHVTYAYEIETGQRRIKHAAIAPSKLFED